MPEPMVSPLGPLLAKAEARIAELEAKLRHQALEHEIAVYAPSILGSLRAAAVDSVILRNYLVKAGALLPPTLAAIWREELLK